MPDAGWLAVLVVEVRIAAAVFAVGHPVATDK